MQGVRLVIGILAALAVASCGTARRTPAVHASSSREADAPIILPLTDSADIARTRERAQAVMDSIDRIQSSGVVPPADGGLAIKPERQNAPVASKELVDDLLDYAKTFLGVPYRLGASGPERFDCSGFTSYVFREFGYQLPHNSVMQAKQSTLVESFSDLRKGDLVFFVRGTASATSATWASSWTWTWNAACSVSSTPPPPTALKSSAPPPLTS